MTKKLTKSEYARYRGFSRQYVNKLIKQGRIKPGADGFIDVAKADKNLPTLSSDHKNRCKPSKDYCKPQKKSCKPKPQLDMNQDHQIHGEIYVDGAIELLSQNLVSEINLGNLQHIYLYIALIKKIQYDEAVTNIFLNEKTVDLSSKSLRQEVIDNIKDFCKLVPCSDDIRDTVNNVIMTDIKEIFNEIDDCINDE